jgi:hypothetical protein
MLGANPERGEMITRIHPLHQSCHPFKVLKKHIMFFYNRVTPFGVCIPTSGIPHTSHTSYLIPFI